MKAKENNFGTTKLAMTLQFVILLNLKLCIGINSRHYIFISTKCYYKHEQVI